MPHKIVQQTTDSLPNLSDQKHQESSSSSLNVLRPSAPASIALQITPQNIMQLQRLIGNYAVTRMLSNSNRTQSRPQPAVVQRTALAPAPLVGAQGGMIDGDVEAAIRNQRSSSAPLSETIRRTLEPHLGRDLSEVRTHTDATSVQLNEQLGAKAFTYGRDIFYGKGHSPNDIQLTAHEATHYVQQQNPATTSEDHVRPTPKKSSLSSTQPRIQRDKDKIEFQGQTGSIDKGNKDAFQSTVTKMAAKRAKPAKAKEKAKAVMLMGPVGAGKSSILEILAPDRTNFVHADADQVKEAIPEYKAGVKQGDKDIATKVHQQSKATAKSIASHAIETRRNLLFDGSGGDLGDYMSMITAMRKQGYHITLGMTHISVDEGLKRVAERALVTGRHIPEKLVRDMYHWVPKNFPSLAGAVDRAFLFDNMVPKGQPPRLIWEKEDGVKLKDGAITDLNALLSSIGSKKMEDSTAAPTPGGQKTDTRDNISMLAHRRYLEAGGTSRWMDDAGSTQYGISTSRGAIGQLDTNLKLYRQYKAKNFANAETQGKLLLSMKRDIESSKYQNDTTKNTKTFLRRRRATTILLEEIKSELRTNPARLKRTTRESDQMKSLIAVGFSKEFLNQLLKLDVGLLYEAHAALSHQQLGLAQQAFDKLNPIERETDGSLKYDGAYIKRTRGTLHFAQQILSAHHHQNIGGEYGRTFAKPESVSDERLKKVTDKYVRNKDLLGQGVLNHVKNSQTSTKTLDQLVQDHSELTSQEIEAIRIYTSNTYRQMNATMHDVRLDNPKEQKNMKGYSAINQLAVSGLDKLPAYKGRYTYRGDSNFGGLLNTARPGTVFQMPSFMSTSKGENIAGGFGGDVGWAIKLASPSRGKDLEHISVAHMEKEVLFPPGTKMKVIDVYRVKGDWENGDFASLDGESMEQKLKRLWRNDKGKPPTKDLLPYVKFFNLMSRTNLIVVQEIR